MDFCWGRIRSLPGKLRQNTKGGEIDSWSSSKREGPLQCEKISVGWFHGFLFVFFWREDPTLVYCPNQWHPLLAAASPPRWHPLLAEVFLHLSDVFSSSSLSSISVTPLSWQRSSSTSVTPSPGATSPLFLLPPSPGRGLPPPQWRLLRQQPLLYLCYPPPLEAVYLPFSVISSNDNVVTPELLSKSLVQYVFIPKTTSKASQRVSGFCVLTRSQSLSALEEKAEKKRAESKMKVKHKWAMEEKKGRGKSWEIERKRRTQRQLRKVKNDMQQWLQSTQSSPQPSG